MSQITPFSIIKYRAKISKVYNSLPSNKNMFFKTKKDKEKEKCPNCKSKLEEEFSFCPYCGLSLVDKEKEMKDFGLLGRNEFADKTSANTLLAQQGFGFSDKMFNALFNTVMRSMEKQLKNADKDIANNISSAKIKPIPGGFSISIGPVPINKQQAGEKPRQTSRKAPTAEQLKKISSLPRKSAKSNVKRLGNKIIYELGMEGIKSPKDIFVSKLEKGYEIKALGDKHVYVNTIPLDLPVKTFKIDKDKITLEFKTQF